MLEKRFSLEWDVDMATGRTVEAHLIDNVGGLPRLAFTDSSDLYEYQKALTDELNELENEIVRLTDKNLQLTLLLNDDQYYKKMVKYRKMYVDVCDELSEEAKYCKKLEEENKSLLAELKSKQRVIDSCNDFISELKKDGVLDD